MESIVFEVVLRIRIRIMLGSWIRIRIKVETGSGSASMWKAESGSVSTSKWKGENFRGSFWSIGGSKSERWVVGAGSASNLKVGFGSGSASEWKVGSGSGSASKWKAGSATLLWGPFICFCVWNTGSLVHLAVCLLSGQFWDHVSLSILRFLVQKFFSSIFTFSVCKQIHEFCIVMCSWSFV